MEKNVRIHIDGEMCIGCGLCASDCVAGNLTVEDGKARVRRQDCILCGHCEAICPKGAVTISGFEDEVVEMEQVRLNPQQLMDAIRTRRTVRQFKEDAVPAAVVNQIIEAGRLAPTGVNAQGTSYIVLDKQKDALEGMAVKLFHSLSGVVKPLKGMGVGEHFFFKKAPVVIVVVGDKLNAALAAENMAFMAEAHGLGVLFSGFFTICANVSPKLHRALGLKATEKVATTLVLGYPAVKYQRTVRRKAPRVRRL